MLVEGFDQSRWTEGTARSQGLRLFTRGIDKGKVSAFEGCSLDVLNVARVQAGIFLALA